MRPCPPSPPLTRISARSIMRVLSPEFGESHMVIIGVWETVGVRWVSNLRRATDPRLHFTICKARGQCIGVDTWGRIALVLAAEAQSEPAHCDCGPFGWVDGEGRTTGSRRQGASGARSARAHSRINERDSTQAGRHSSSRTTARERSTGHSSTAWCSSIISSLGRLRNASSGGPFRSRLARSPRRSPGLSLPGVSSSSTPARRDQSVLRPPPINQTLRAEQPVAAVSSRK